MATAAGRTDLVGCHGQAAAVKILHQLFEGGSVGRGTAVPTVPSSSCTCRQEVWGGGGGGGGVENRLAQEFPHLRHVEIALFFTPASKITLACLNVPTCKILETECERGWVLGWWVTMLAGLGGSTISRLIKWCGAAGAVWMVRHCGNESCKPRIQTSEMSTLYGMVFNLRFSTYVLNTHPLPHKFVHYIENASQVRTYILWKSMVVYSFQFISQLFGKRKLIELVVTNVWFCARRGLTVRACTCEGLSMRWPSLQQLEELLNGHPGVRGAPKGEDLPQQHTKRPAAETPQLSQSNKYRNTVLHARCFGWDNLVLQSAI